MPWRPSEGENPWARYNFSRYYDGGDEGDIEKYRQDAKKEIHTANGGFGAKTT